MPRAACARAAILAAVAAVVPVADLTVADVTDKDRPFDRQLADGTATADRARWRSPVAGVLVDPFRPPSHPYGPGNRGLEFAVTDAASVAAVADGSVVFAGQVGRDFHIVVGHGNGLLSGYSHLELVSVAEGERVERGEAIGQASGRFHLSARLAPGASEQGFTPWGKRRYVDPLPLLGLELRIRLVAD